MSSQRGFREEDRLLTVLSRIQIPAGQTYENGERDNAARIARRSLHLWRASSHVVR